MKGVAGTGQGFAIAEIAIVTYGSSRSTQITNTLAPRRDKVFARDTAHLLLVDAHKVLTGAGESSIEKNQRYGLIFPEPFKKGCALFHRRPKNGIALPRQHQLDEALLIFRILLRRTNHQAVTRRLNYLIDAFRDFGKVGFPNGGDNHSHHESLASTEGAR